MELAVHLDELSRVLPYAVFALLTWERLTWEVCQSHFESEHLSVRLWLAQAEPQAALLLLPVQAEPLASQERPLASQERPLTAQVPPPVLSLVEREDWTGC